MKAIAAYMANKNRENGNDRRNEYQDPGRREYENRSEYGGQRQPNQYPQRNPMGGYWPENNDQRGVGDGRGREMNDYGGAESRYRGRDGRWKAGTRRSEYDGDARDTYPTGRRMGDDDQADDVQSNVIQWPYAPGMPHIPPESRMIGFGNRPREYETRSHYDGGRQEAELGGTMWMEPVGRYHHKEEMMLDRETAEKWVHEMHNEDPARPTGARWNVEEIKPYAAKYGIKPESEKYIEFYAMMNAMYSDYCEVAKKHNVNNPDFYAAMAKAWMDDKDAVHNKTAMYYECCVEK